MSTTRYDSVTRFADWWHGWRDGRHGVPLRRRGRTTTPHRDVLIRSARDAFEHERLGFEAARAALMQAAAAAEARLDGAQERLLVAEGELAMVPARPDARDLTRRRLGEDRRPDVVVAHRRAREHDRRRQQLMRARDAAAAERDRHAAELAAALEAVERERTAAAARVRRVHENSHRRLATYRRRLVRSHPEGDKIDWELDGAVPHVPAWVEADELDPPPILAPAPDGDPPARIVRIGPVTTLGSADTADVQLNGVLVAPDHATLRREGEGFTLEDRGRGGGTFVVGRQIRRVGLHVGETFVIGNHELTIASSTELAIRPVPPPSLVAWELSSVLPKQRKGEPTPKRRLDRMSFVQHEGTVLAILGPSGAGKSSLFSALLGELETDEGGRLFFGQLDMQAHGEQIRSQLGFVPQDDSLHRTLRVRTLLAFSDRLRSPKRRGDRTGRIAEVCRKLDIRQLDKRVDELSGGQRKRVSVALELLANPTLLMLDEPTSGLDAGMDREVMGILRDMAKGVDDGRPRTVVVVTHSPEHLHLADRVLLLGPEGRPVYLGGHFDVLANFGRLGLPASSSGEGAVPSYADLMKALFEKPQLTDAWVQRYREGPQAVAARDAVEQVQARAAAAEEPGDLRPRRRRAPSFVLQQFRWLFVRQWVLLLARAPVGSAKGLRKQVQGAFVVAMPVLIGAIGATVAALVSADGALGSGPKAAPTALNLLVTLCMLAGQSLTYSDIVSEFDVIRREARTGVAPASVVLAKWSAFAVVAVAQAAVITVLFVWWRGAPDVSVVAPPAVELGIGLALLSVAAMSSGLLVSAVATRLEQAVLLSTGLAIAQVAFNGWTADLASNGWLNVLSLPLPARWGLAATASTVDLQAKTGVADELWRHTSAQWWLDIGWLAGLSAGFVLLTVAVLRRRVTPRRSGRRRVEPRTGAGDVSHGSTIPGARQR